METVTARLVGMEINVNSSAISPPGRARGDARLQTAESAVAEVCHSYTCVIHTRHYTIGRKTKLFIANTFFSAFPSGWEEVAFYSV